MRRPYQKTHVRWSNSVARCNAMADLYRSGKTLREIAKLYGCSDKNIHNHLKRIGISSRDGGRLKLAADRKDQRRARKEALSLKLYGCSCSESCTFDSKIRMAFTAQKVGAGQRGIAWKFTLPAWWTIWEASGHWHGRGPGAGYMMCRYGDVGPYSASNVYIASGRENSSAPRSLPVAA